jgi:hypothetical protein
MKISLLFLLFLSTACEYGTLKYGYYWNPLTVLEKADEALAKGDLDGWSNLLSGKTLCIYGSEEGMRNIRSTMARISTSAFQEPALISKKYLATPSYIGYWSYYQETYQAVGKTSSGKTALSVTLICDFGHPQNRADLKGASLNRYSTRSCSITKMENHLNPIVVPDYCF